MKRMKEKFVISSQNIQMLSSHQGLDLFNYSYLDYQDFIFQNIEIFQVWCFETGHISSDIKYDC